MLPKSGAFSLRDVINEFGAVDVDKIVASYGDYNNPFGTKYYNTIDASDGEKDKMLSDSITDRSKLVASYGSRKPYSLNNGLIALMCGEAIVVPKAVLLTGADGNNRTYPITDIFPEYNHVFDNKIDKVYCDNTSLPDKAILFKPNRTRSLTELRAFDKDMTYKYTVGDSDGIQNPMNTIVPLYAGAEDVFVVIDWMTHEFWRGQGLFDYIKSIFVISRDGRTCMKTVPVNKGYSILRLSTAPSPSELSKWGTPCIRPQYIMEQTYRYFPVPYNTYYTDMCRALDYVIADKGKGLRKPCCDPGIYDVHLGDIGLDPHTFFKKVTGFNGTWHSYSSRAHVSCSGVTWSSGSTVSWYNETTGGGGDGYTYGVSSSTDPETGATVYTRTSTYTSHSKWTSTVWHSSVNYVTRSSTNHRGKVDINANVTLNEVQANGLYRLQYATKSGYKRTTSYRVATISGKQVSAGVAVDIPVAYSEAVFDKFTGTSKTNGDDYASLRYIGHSPTYSDNVDIAPASYKRTGVSLLINGISSKKGMVA